MMPRRTYQRNRRRSRWEGNKFYRPRYGINQLIPYPTWNRTETAWAIGWGLMIMVVSGSWLLAVIAAGCLFAAYDDCKRGMIPDRVVAVCTTAVVTQLATYWVMGDSERAQIGLIAMGFALVVYEGACAAEYMGGGDAKLLSGVLTPAWAVGPHLAHFDVLYAMSFLMVLHFMIVCGSVIVIAAATRGNRRMVTMGAGFLFAHIATALFLAG